MLESLHQQLKTENLSAGVLSVWLQSEDRQTCEDTLRLRQPSANLDHLMRGCLSLLEKVTLKAGITTAALTLHGLVDSTPQQLNLFEELPAQRVGLEKVIARLQKRHAGLNLYKSSLNEAPALIPERGFQLHLFEAL